MPIERPTTPEKPWTGEGLSDEQMGNLVSAFGNNEAKIILIILMRDGNIFDVGNLHQVLMDAQGENKGWRMNKRAPFNYCSKSLAPIGLVAQEVFGKDLSTFGYSITPYGQKAIPLGGLLLGFSEKYSIPLNLLLGATASPSKATTIQTKEGKSEFKKRSPSTTLKILRELLASPSLPIREVDLMKKLGEDYTSSVLPHLIRLQKLGLIEYDAIEVNKPFSSYKLSPSIPEGELPIYQTDKRLTRSVFQVLKDHPDDYLTKEEVYNFLPKEQKETWKNEILLRRIPSILFFLNQHKYADVKKFHKSRQSEINVTAKQRGILSEFLEIMDGFQKQDSEILEKGRTLAEKIIVDPERVSNLLGRAKEASSKANQSSREETQGYILSIILSNPTGITNKEIQELLEKGYEKKLGTTNISRHCSSLREQKRIGVEKEGSVNTYYPINNDPLQGVLYLE